MELFFFRLLWSIDVKVDNGEDLYFWGVFLTGALYLRDKHYMLLFMA